MKSSDLRKKYLNFFEVRDHKVISSASLVPENDPTVLFTTAGMHPLVPYLLGEKHPFGKRLASAQKCIRTDDIDEVGDKIHHTFFEMLGNWSLGDYFKKEAIKWSFEFLTSNDGLNIPIERLAVSVFAGDSDASFDQESYDLWAGLGISSDRIAKLPKKNNWWGPAGETGPCGPDTEMFVWTGEGEAPKNFQQTHEDSNWVEIWNDVFMQYNKVKKNDSFVFEKLLQHNVDTGMGMERALAVLNDTDDNYRTDLFWPIIEEIESISGKKYEGNEVEFRIIADHIKAASFAIGDGALPSNKASGYIVRRLMRRAIVKAHQLGISENFTTKLAEKVFGIYEGVYSFNHELILSELEKEETKFRRTLAEGLKVIKTLKEVSGKDLFDLYQSAGLPLEIAVEEAKNQGIEINNLAIEQYNNLVRQHQELSRTASAGMFKGGLSEAGEITTKYHTATHLLLAALRKVLGDHVYQKGSNITAERIRFDFSHPDKMTQEQVKEVENIVNENIAADLPVSMEEMTLEDAKACGAMGVFESKYGEKVKVYTIGQMAQGGGPLTDRPSASSHSSLSMRAHPSESKTGSRDFISSEICGGPHVSRTSELGNFRILKEEASSAGVRRIKAVLE